MLTIETFSATIMLCFVREGVKVASGVTKWLLHKFTDINRGRMNEHIAVMQKNTGKSKAYIYFALMWSFITRGTGYTDFFRGNFLCRTKAEKDTYVTAKSFYKILSYLNNPAYTMVIEDKLVFNEMFKGFLGREFINLRTATPEDFAAFLKGKSFVFAKDPAGYGGHSVIKIDVSEVESTEQLYNELTAKNMFLVEQQIIQHKELNAINPNVVNSFRVITLMKDGTPHIINNALRVNKGADNVIGSTEDVYFSLNENGKIDSNVIDDLGNVYTTHPLTGVKFADVKISDVDKAFTICKTAAKKVPQVRYIGWDIAFSENGPVLVEGNEYPGYGILQHYKLKDKRTGHLKEIADVLGDEIKNIKI